MSTLSSVRPSFFHRLGRSKPVSELVWPHGLAGILSPFDPVRNAAGDATRITSVVRETATMATIAFEVPRSWRGRPFEAGQHVLLGVEIDGRRQTRAFSLSSSARREDRKATVTVRINPFGTVSRHLVTTAAPGDVLYVGVPQGTFTLPAGDRPLLLVSGGSGITPVLAMLRTLVDDVLRGDAAPRPVTFLHYTRDVRDVPFRRELERLADQHRWIDLLVVVTGDGEAHGEHALAGRLDATHLRRALGAVPTDVRACGPAGLATTLEDLLDGDDRIASFHAEWFHPPSRSAAPGGGTITFTRSGVTVTDDGRPLLDQAEDAGLTPQFGCRMGICHTCVTPRVDGVVRDVVTDLTCSDDTEHVRLCVSTAEGDVSLAL